MRWQVLYDATPPAKGSDVINCRTRKEANAIAARLRKEGHTGISIWDTQNNPLSNLLRIG